MRASPTEEKPVHLRERRDSEIKLAQRVLSRCQKVFIDIAEEGCRIPTIYQTGITLFHLPEFAI